jgi:hypothetical protein
MARTVATAFEELLARQRLTDKQEETARTRVTSLSGYFVNNFHMDQAPFPVGSYARGTICAKERDIDMLAPFSVAHYWERYKNDSRAFLYWVRNDLNDHYATTKVSSRQVAVKLDFTVITTDIVPCFPRTGGGYLMPNGSSGWMATNPPFHTQLVADSDKAHNWRMKRLIKLIKAWNIANSHHLSSFHVELMVVAMKQRYSVGSWASEVAAVLKTMPSWVRASFPDPWPPGVRVDSYLSSSDRALVIRMLEADAKAAEQALQLEAAGRTEAAFERWAVVYRGTFPAYG